MKQVKGTELFITALKEEGVDLLFAYPGGSAIDLFDALYDHPEIEVVLPRHEQGLIHAADGYARSTGRVGVCLVTSGPGATNLVTGIATANYDCVPLVCFTGQVSRNLIGNDAFQEVDIVGITRSIAKHTVTVHKRDDLGRILKEAFYIARTGKPGPVVVDLPKDIQKALGSGEYPSQVNIRSYKPISGVHEGQLKKALQLLEKAKRPIFLLGGGVKLSRAEESMVKLAEKTRVPVVTTIMGKGAVPTDHPLYLGNLGIHGSYAVNTAVNDCDVLFSIGTRFNDRITGKTCEFAQKAKIVHIDIDTASISKNIVVDIPIVADAKVAIDKLLEMASPVETKEWMDQIADWNRKHPLIPQSEGPGLTPYKIVKKINERFQGKSIITTDVGQNQLWVSQFLDLYPGRQLLTSGGLGTMGYGFPAAMGAKIANPDTDVICVSGDGGMQMNIQEMATAVSLELPLILCVLNNSRLGNVRQMQELFHNKRYHSTCLLYRKSCNRVCLEGKPCPPAPYIPDFVKLAESYGAAGIRVEREEDIEAAFDQAKANEKAPTLIEFVIEPEANVWPIVAMGQPLSDMIIDC